MTHLARFAARLTPALTLTLLAAVLLGVPLARSAAPQTAAHGPVTPLIAGDNDKGGMGG